MSYIFKTRLGKQLYLLLPEVYRTRDKQIMQTSGASGTDDLAKYLDAHGYLLDQIYSTLKQQLDDVLPESSQDWLLPYFAQLLAANILSPDSKGKHAEIDNAILWRQRKGTKKCVENIAEAIGQMEVEVQEGWKRVAMTPRIGMPIIPAKAWDTTLEFIDKEYKKNPSVAAKHPGLPAAMVDLRQASRAIETSSTNPAAKVSTFTGLKQLWRQSNRHGTPCFPDGFDDVTRRTVDLRSPGAEKGCYHHKRLLVYAPPPTGMFPLPPLVIEWGKAFQQELIEIEEESGVTIYRNATSRELIVFDTTKGNQDDTIILDAGKTYRIENIHFSNILLLEDGHLELINVQATKVKVDTFSTDIPVLTAVDCLFNELSVGSGLAKLDSCTVLSEAHFSNVDINDSIIMEIPDDIVSNISGTFKYSRLPNYLLQVLDEETKKTCVSDDPKYLTTNNDFLAANSVLSPNTPKSIYAGASDGKEMGCFHRGRKNRPVFVNSDLELQLFGNTEYILEDLVFTGNFTVISGSLKLLRCAVKMLTIESVLHVEIMDEVEPGLVATESIFENLIVPDNLVRLEYCTIMDTAKCRFLQASDCIFAGSLINIVPANTYSDPPVFLNCIRYSRIPVNLDDNVIESLRIKDNHNKIRLGSNTTEPPIFIRYDYCQSNPAEPQMFAESGYGVLSRDTSDLIRFGAEDGGEMGACHCKFISLKAEAMLDKMREFLPIGIEPVLIQDVRLLHLLPAQNSEYENKIEGQNYEN